jgi:2-dehydropantoate 2-reductase
MTINSLHIVGTGAIGSILAASTQNAQIDYTIHSRHKTHAYKEVNLYTGEQLQLAPQDCARPPSSALFVIPVKVYQLNNLLQQWQHKIGKRTPILLLQNGMGGQQIAQKYLPDNPLFLATTSHAAYNLNSHTVKHSGLGQTMLGAANDETKTQDALCTQVFSLFARAFPPVSWQANIQFSLWQKLLVNAVINPLTALNNVKNGALADPIYADDIRQLCHEVCAVAQAANIDLDETVSLDLVYQIITATANNYSSMHQDVQRKQRTEIDAISGFIIAQAKKMGIDVPINTQLYKAVSALTN